jgi:hypothetical protein
MDVQSLLSSSNTYQSILAEATKLAGKWEKSGLLEGLGEKEKTQMALILENQAKQLVVEQSSTGVGASFSAGQGEQWAGVALPLVRKVFAQISTKDFVSVQPMTLPSGLIFFLDFKYGTGVNGFGANTNMYGNVSTAGDKMSVDEEVSGGLYGAGRFGYSINQKTGSAAGVAPVAATLADLGYDATLATGSYAVIAVPLSTISGYDVEGIRAFRLRSGSATLATFDQFTKIDGTALEFVVPSGSIVSGSSVQVLYHVQPADNSRGDFEDAPASSISIPEINVELRSEPITAKTRKLKAQWTPEFAQDLSAYQSVDAEAELTSLLSEYISMEIDLEILDMLIAGAVTTEKWSAVSNKVWNGSAWVTNGVSDGGFYNTQGQWFQTLGTKVQKVSNKIHQKTLRGGANFLVCSPSVATILESIPGYAADTNGDKLEFAMGVQKVGSLNSRFKVYKNPYMTENTILLGYKGSQFLETGAAYAPYIPLMMTPLVYDPNTFTPRKGVMTRYAKKLVRPEFYGRIFVSDLAVV